MSIAFWWIPNVLAAVGLLVCIVQGVRRHSAGLILFAVYFAYNLTLAIVAAVRQHGQEAEYVRSFVPRQVGPNTSTAPVLHSSVNLAAPFTQAVLVLAAILLSRRIVARRAG
jgi:hypothetical protein